MKMICQLLIICCVLLLPATAFAATCTWCHKEIWTDYDKVCNVCTGKIFLKRNEKIVWEIVYAGNKSENTLLANFSDNKQIIDSKRNDITRYNYRLPFFMELKSDENPLRFNLSFIDKKTSRIYHLKSLPIYCSGCRYIRIAVTKTGNGNIAGQIFGAKNYSAYSNYEATLEELTETFRLEPGESISCAGLRGEK